MRLKGWEDIDIDRCSLGKIFYPDCWGSKEKQKQTLSTEKIKPSVASYLTTRLQIETLKKDKRWNGELKKGWCYCYILLTYKESIIWEELDGEREREKEGGSRVDFSYEYSYLTGRFFRSRKRSKKICCNPVLFVGEREKGR